MTSQVHTIESAPEGSRPILEQAQKALGFVPNLYAVFAESPALLKAYTTLGGIFDQSSFNPTERQVVLLSASFENECAYCMGAHSTIAGMQGVADDVVHAVRQGGPIQDPRLQALSVFTKKVVANRGWVSSEDVRAFRDAGFTEAQLLEVILGIGLKTLSNYTNHLAETPLDEAFQPQAWSSPRNAQV